MGSNLSKIGQILLKITHISRGELDCYAQYMYFSRIHIYFVQYNVYVVVFISVQNVIGADCN